MLKLGQKIGQGLLLLVIGLALIGVNVKQLYCSHSEYLHWEVCLLPVEDSCPCDGDCCGEQSCHHNARYDFYKITDFSTIESGIQLLLPAFFLPESSHRSIFCLLLDEISFFPLRDKIPDRVLSRELLCTYLC